MLIECSLSAFLFTEKALDEKYRKFQWFSLLQGNTRIKRIELLEFNQCSENEKYDSAGFISSY